MSKTSEEIYTEAVTISHQNNQTVGEKNDFYITLEQLDEILKDCGFACGWSHFAGFVPEAGCPIHD